MHGMKTLLGGALLLLAAGCGQSVSDKIDTVDELLRAELPMMEANRREAETLRDEARRLMQAGNPEAAGAAADKALGLLQRAKDAALMNKSDG